MKWKYLLKSQSYQLPENVIVIEENVVSNKIRNIDFENIPRKGRKQFSTT